MSCIVDVGKEPECQRVKSSNKEPLNWLPRLPYFGDDFFLAVAGLLILEKYSKGIIRSSDVYYFPYL